MSNLDYTLGLLTNVFTQFFDALLKQEFEYPNNRASIKKAFATDVPACTYASAGPSCTGTVIASPGAVIPNILTACSARASV